MVRARVASGKGVDLTPRLALVPGCRGTRIIVPETSSRVVRGTPETIDCTACVLLAGDAEAREEEYMANGPYTAPLTLFKVQNYITT
jgi:hypothetical protein